MTANPNTARSVRIDPAAYIEDLEAANARFRLEREEAVGLLRKFREVWTAGGGWATRMDELEDDVRAFLSRMESRDV